MALRSTSESRISIFLISLFIALVGGMSLPATEAWGNAVCKISGTKIQIPELVSEFPEIQTKLNRGLTVTLVHQMPFGEWKCSLLLDLWDEVYAVNAGWAGQENSNFKTKKISDALIKCAEFDLSTGMKMPQKFELISILDPVSEEQMARTRKWLAERGIGKGSSAIVGRAVGAILDLKDNRTVVRTCSSGR